MSREQNLDIVKRWFQLVWNERREDLIDTFINPAGVAHLEGKDIRTPDEFRDLQREFFSAFPDLSVVVEDTLADDTNVVVRWLATGTHNGHGFDRPPTGRPIAIRGMVERAGVVPMRGRRAVRVGLRSDGLLVELWWFFLHAGARALTGEIIAAGKGRLNEDGDRVEMDVKVGDIVLFAKYAGTEFKHEDEDPLILSEKDILAIIED